MTTARLYWYPEDDAPLRELDLGRSWTDLADAPGDDQVTATSAGGHRVITTLTSTRLLEATIEYLQDYSVVRELEAVLGHLRRNGVIGLAEEADVTWAGFSSRTVERGATTVRIEGNLWRRWSSPVLEAGDIVVVQGASPRGVHEEAVVESVSADGLRVTLTEGLLHDYQDEPYVLVRDRRFWPLLQAQDKALGAGLTTSHRLWWNLQLALQEPPNRLARSAERGETYRGTADRGHASYGLAPEDPTVTPTLRS